jgi:hypothetical protein
MTGERAQAYRRITRALSADFARAASDDAIGSRAA